MGKSYRCSIRADKVCEHKKKDAYVVLKMCLKCLIFRKFLREMDWEEDVFFDEADRARGSG